ncbi:MAG: 3-phosphoserine/phosphohydroxythreonine transaminase [Pseudomonadota bacterium]
MVSIYNFSAGPSLLPREVMEQVQAEFLDWHGTGLSVMEMSHRSAAYESIIHGAEADLRKLLAIPEEYAVLFMQGGGVGQFDAVPLNLRPEGKSADYVITGDWSKKAFNIASGTGRAHMALSNASSHYFDLPKSAEGNFNRDAAYLHFCSNETISGVEFPDLPDLPTDVPWIADMSSNILSRPISIARYGLIYASAQKNIGPAGFSVVIVHRELLNKALPITPAVLNYTILAENGSMFNTPPTFAIYVSGLVFQWLLRQGGLVAIEQKNKEKAQLVYNALDASALFKCPIAPAARSMMNIPFTSGNADIDARFLSFVEPRKLVQLKGHKSVGGMRASLYNAMPIEGVHALTEALRDFEKSADF